MENDIIQGYELLMELKSNLYSDYKGVEEEKEAYELCNRIIEIYDKYNEDEIIQIIKDYTVYSEESYCKDMITVYIAKGTILLNKAYEEKTDFEDTKDCFFKAKEYSDRISFSIESKKNINYYIGLSLLFNLEVEEAGIILKSLYRDGYLSKENIDAANEYLIQNNRVERIEV